MTSLLGALVDINASVSVVLKSVVARAFERADRVRAHAGRIASVSPVGALVLVLAGACRSLEAGFAAADVRADGVCAVGIGGTRRRDLAFVDVQTGETVAGEASFAGACVCLGEALEGGIEGKLTWKVSVQTALA